MSNVTGKIIALGGGGGASEAEVEELRSAIANIGGVTPEQYGAKGDGTTDDSEAVQAACDAGHEIRFASNKTYFLASPVVIDHDCHLIGGENTVIKTATPSGGTVDNGIVVSGTLKKTTTMTTDYSSSGSTANCNNKFTLSDMDGIEIGDLICIKATDQYYHYARDYYYLGATLMVTDIYDGHLYTADYMPWNIENTANVSVKIYSAPTVTIEGIHFVSDLNSIGTYRYLLLLERCKNSIVKNCTFSTMANGIKLTECSNIEINSVSLSKSKYNNELSGDGYGIFIDKCTNTILDRIVATCAQHAVAISGSNGVTMNTYVYRSNFTAECRTPGFDTHENTYNLVIEDCVLGTAVLNATCKLNRCKVFTNRRAEASDNATISVYGSYNPEWSRIQITNTEFNGAGLYVMRSVGQDPVQSYNNYFGCIEIENCIGGWLYLNLETSSMILSNTIKKLSIKNWKNCNRIFNPGTGIIEEMMIEDSTFTEKYWINKNTDAYWVNNIRHLHFTNDMPKKDILSVYASDHGGDFFISHGTVINVSGTNNSAYYTVCGKNLASNKVADYSIGSVSGSAGNDLTRSVNDNFANALSVDANGNMVYTQPSSYSGKGALYGKCLLYVDKPSVIKLTCKLKNTGATSAASFSPCIAIVNASTGKVVTRVVGDSVQATAQGASVSYARTLDAGTFVMMYLYNYTAVQGSETTIEDYMISIYPLELGSSRTVPFEEYKGDSRTGNGTIISQVDGMNHILCSDMTFSMNFMADNTDV